jgi:hypothetical protein
MMLAMGLRSSWLRKRGYPEKWVEVNSLDVSNLDSVLHFGLVHEGCYLLICSASSAG